MEFVEMFKAPIKVLHPLLTATQEGNYNSTEGLGAPALQRHHPGSLQRIGMAQFPQQQEQRAFIDRIYIVKVPYCLRVADEIKIYDKLLVNSSLAHAHCAPDTLKMLSQFSVLSRLKEPENSNIYSKMRVYDGENLKDTDPKAKSIQEYRDSAGVDEGMAGLSTRFAFKILSKVFNFDPHEVAANPVHLLYVLEQQIEQEQFQPETRERYLRFIKEYLAPRYVEFIGKEIQTAYLESYSEYGQNIFDRYVLYADFWIQDQEYRDPETGEILNRAALNEELEKIETRGHQQRRTSATRSSTSCCAPRRQQRQEPELAVLREAARGDREEDVLQHRGPASGHQLQRQGQQGGPAEAQRLRQTHGRARLHREAGPPAVGMVPAGSQVAVVCHRYGRCDRTGRRRIRTSAPPLRRGATGPEEHS